MENTILVPVSTAADTSAEINVFKNLIERTTSLINEQGYNLRPYSPESLQKLETLSLLEIRKCNSKLIHNLQLIESTANVLSKISNKNLVRNIVSIMNIQVNDDFVDQIADDDIVEIYNPECIQIFRNLKFYETTTYSLSDLLLFDWSELYYRPSQISQKIQTYITEVLSTNNHKVILDMDVPTHMIKEIKANPIQLCEIEFRKIAPIMDSFGNRAGLIVTCKAKSLLSDISHTGIDFI